MRNKNSTKDLTKDNKKKRKKRKALPALAIIGLVGLGLLPQSLGVEAATSGDYTYSTNADGTITLTSYTGANTTLEIPAAIDGKTVSALGSGVGYNSFTPNAKLTSVTIPEGIRAINKATFYNESLTSIDLPDSLRLIGEEAFKINKLTNLDMPDGVISLGKGAFAANSLTSVHISERLTSLPVRAFQSNQLQSVVIPASVTEIGTAAFEFNAPMKELTALNKDTAFPALTMFDTDSTFDNTDQTNVTVKGIPGGKVEDYVKNTAGDTYTLAFESYTGAVPDPLPALSEEDAAISGTFTFTENTDGTVAVTGYTGTGSKVTIPEQIEGKTVTSIADNAFKAKALSEVTIPGTVKTIGQSAFEDAGLTKVTLNDGLVTIKDYAFDSNALTSVSIPDSVKVMGKYAFFQNKLESVDLSDSVAAINQRAFSGNKLKSVTLPASVGNVYSEAFAYNPLEEVTVLSKYTKFEESWSSIYDDIFKGTSSPVLTIYGYEGSTAQQYAIDTPGNGYTIVFADYVEPAPEPEPTPEPTPEPEAPENGSGNEGDSGTDTGNGSDSGADAGDGTDTGTETGNGGSTGGSTGSTSSEDKASFNLLGGPFELATAPVQSFGDIEIPEATTTYDAAFSAPFNVKDLSGKQQGWRVDVAATQFKVTDGAESFTMPVGSLKLAGLESIDRVGEGTSAMPTSKLSDSTIIDDGAVTVVSAAQGAGVGSFDLAFPEKALSVTIDPSAARVDPTKAQEDGKTPYEATIKWDLVQAP